MLRNSVLELELNRLALEPRLSRLDPNELAEFCFADAAGRPLHQAGLHRDLQRFLGRHGRALVELPRDHGKSVQVCIRVLWELGHDPGLRVKLVCASDELAAERCRFLRDHLRDNARLQRVFPRLHPGGVWGKQRLIVRRPSHVIGPSVTAVGVGAASVGSRADLLVCDDLVDVRALTSRAARERVEAVFFDNLMNQLEPDGRLWCLFTPWHRDDLNAVLKRKPAFALFRRSVGDESEPVWPEHWPRERLLAREQEIGSLAFARGYRLQCLSEEAAPLKAHWIQFWTGMEPQINAEERRSEKHPIGSAQRLSGCIGGSSSYERLALAVDPAVSTRTSADRSALVTLGQTPAGEIHVLEAVARRVAAPELVGLLDDADRRWRPDVILFESNAAFAGLRDLLLRHAGFGPKIKSVTQTREKYSRMVAFSVPVENGTFRLKGRVGQVDAGQQELWDERAAFPADRDLAMHAFALSRGHGEWHNPLRYKYIRNGGVLRMNTILFILDPPAAATQPGAGL